MPKPSSARTSPFLLDFGLTGPAAMSVKAGEGPMPAGLSAGALGVRRLYALCHTGHEGSRRVLEKGGFIREGVLRQYMEFPNLAPGEPADVFCYSLIL